MCHPSHYHQRQPHWMVILLEKSSKEYKSSSITMYVSIKDVHIHASVRVFHKVKLLKSLLQLYGINYYNMMQHTYLDHTAMLQCLVDNHTVLVVVATGIPFHSGHLDSG